MYAHTEFIDMYGPNGEVIPFDKKPSFADFQNMVSEFDKKSILWGIYAATYESFGKQEITCPNCQDKWEDTITAEQVINDESFDTWDEPVPFSEFLHPIDIELTDGNPEVSKFRFNTFVPSIKDHLNVLRLISTEKMKDNFDKFGKILSSSEELSLITKSIEIYGVDGTSQEIQLDVPSDVKGVVDNVESGPDKIQGLFDIYKTINEYIPLNIIDDVAKQYDEKFKRYIPTFKKPLSCGQCANDFDFPVDVELALFRSFLRL
jgi:hypothetical protein